MRRFVVAAVIAIGLTAPVMAESSAVHSWWVAFNDPLMNRYVTRVLLENLDVQTAKSRVDAAKASAQTSRSGWWPDISVLGSVSRGNMSSIKDASIHRIGVQGTWNLDLFGGNSATVKSAEAQVDARQADLDNARREIVAELVSTILAWRENRMVKQLMKEQLVEIDSQIALQSDLVAAGLSDQMKVIDIQLKRHQVEAGLPQVEAAITMAMVQIDELLGSTDNRVITELAVADSPQIQLPPFDAVLGTDIAVIQNRPDVQRAKADLLSADASVSATEATLWPTVSLSGFYGVQDTTDGVIQSGSQIWSVGADINYPLFNFGRLQSQVDSADAKKREASLNYQSTVKKALSHTRTAVTNYVNAMSSVTARQSAERSHRAGLALARDQYESGMTNYMVYSSVMVSYLQTRIDASRQYGAAAKAFVSLQSEVGAGL